MMKIAFLGTPDFAIPSLKALLEDGHDVAVFTQPDRPVGRRHILTAPPVKAFAAERGLDVFQFEDIRKPEGMAALSALSPELMVTVAFGQILSAENLAVPRHGCINVHGSLLPKYRGAAPVQWAVINGEMVTGVTTMLTDIGLDTGDILLKKETPIGEDETAGELFDRLAELGAEVLMETVAAIEGGTLKRTKQNESEATRCPMLKKEHGHIDFSKTAGAISALCRGVDPWPGAYGVLGGENVKLWGIRPANVDGARPKEAACGECIAADSSRGILIAAGDGAVSIGEIQFPGGKRMDAKAATLGRELLGRIFT